MPVVTGKVTPGGDFKVVDASKINWDVPKTVLTFSKSGTLATGTNVTFELVAPCSLTITKVKAHVKTAPTGAALIVDVNKGGVTIFTTQSKRPQIAAGATDDDSDAPDVTGLVEGNVLSIDIDQVGSTVAGADLTVEILCVGV